MNLAIILDAVTKEVPRHAKPLADARSRRAPLAPYATPSDVLAALGKSSALAPEERDAIVVALVEEAQSSRNQLWLSMLIAAFAPMLQRLRSRVRRLGNEDFDQRVLTAFIGAVRVAPTHRARDPRAPHGAHGRVKISSASSCFASSQSQFRSTQFTRIRFVRSQTQ